MKKQDLGVALYILAAFVMLIVPIPNTLLDILLAFNMALAFTILFTTMFAKEVLDMSYYPTILLFTTIFRIALNVSSTRLILSTGNPGNVVCRRRRHGNRYCSIYHSDSGAVHCYQ